MLAVVQRRALFPARVVGQGNPFGDLALGKFVFRPPRKEEAPPGIMAPGQRSQSRLSLMVITFSWGS